jgi:rhamnose utilization protein RhaD (predicted bifunctional aldolase and dehydrogenase)
MRENTSPASHIELARLRQLTARIGADPLLTQASTGNSSTKLDGVLWIKASGKWMVDAMDEDILIPLDLDEVIRECLQQGVDPAGRYPGASIETAMHAVLPQRVVLHVHSVNTIAWAVRNDAAVQLQHQLDGLRWKWVSYVASGLPLSQAIEHSLFAYPDTDVFVLGQPRPGHRWRGLQRRRKSPDRAGTTSGHLSATGTPGRLCSVRRALPRFICPVEACATSSISGSAATSAAMP